MNATEATKLLDRLAGSYRYKLNPVETQEYLRIMRPMEIGPATLAVTKLIETHDRFPRVAVLRGTYWSVRGEQLEGNRRQADRSNAPMSADERRGIAQRLAEWAVARLAERAEDEWGAFGLAVADLYTENAARQERGEPLKKLPSFRELLHRLGIPGGDRHGQPRRRHAARIVEACA